MRAGASVGALLIVIGGLGWLLPYALPSKFVEPATLDQAFAAMAAGDFTAARQIAMEVRSNPQLSYREQGGPLYVLGMVIAHDADKLWNPREKRLLHLVAGKYLQEARHRGIPAGHEVTAALQLGRSWHHAREPAAASEALRWALELKTPHAAQARELLAESYLLLVPPQYGKALQVNSEYLAEPGLKQHERQSGSLREARIFLALGELVKCRQALERIPAMTPLAAELAIVKGQLLLAEGEAVLAADPGKVDQAKSLFQQAADAFRSTPQDDIVMREPPPAAQYLLGVCFERLGDDEAAEAQYVRLHRLDDDSPERFAAMLREAELLVRRKAYDDAVQLVVKAFAEESRAARTHNPWMTPPEIERRLGSLQQNLLDGGAFSAALDLAGMPIGVLPAWQLVLWKANAYYEAQAAAAERQAELVSLNKAEPLRAQARADRRRAGREAARLAELRSLEREYTDDLWRSAQQFYLGRDYTHAVQATRKYLYNESQKRRPDALLLLAESQLSLDQADRAIETLSECLESFPRHPVAYRARLVAAKAYAEKGLLVEAQRLLADNVDSEDLSPRSAQWRDSLFMMGKLLHRSGVEAEAKSRKAGVDSEDPETMRRALLELEPAHQAFRAAADKLGKALERYPEAAQARESQYLLADSLRQASKWPRKKMQVVTIEASRTALARQSQLDLEAAVAEYDKLITQLGDVQESLNHSRLEKRLLRNSYFSKADALFDLGRYEDAIRAYSAASNRYQNEPESLEAYVQIAACYRLLNKPQEARGTLQQAQNVLLRMKPEADFTRATPYGREEWQQLLKWLATL